MKTLEEKAEEYAKGPYRLTEMDAFIAGYKERDGEVDSLIYWCKAMRNMLQELDEFNHPELNKLIDL